NFFEFADEISPKVDDVRIDIAMSSAAADPFLQAPDQRKFRIDDPILRIARVIMENVADGAVLNHFFRLSDGWNAPIIMADHVYDLGLFHRIEHLLALLHVQG